MDGPRHYGWPRFGCLRCLLGGGCQPIEMGAFIFWATCQWSPWNMFAPCYCPFAAKNHDFAYCMNLVVLMFKHLAYFSVTNNHPISQLWLHLYTWDLQHHLQVTRVIVTYTQKYFTGKTIENIHAVSSWWPYLLLSRCRVATSKQSDYYSAVGRLGFSAWGTVSDFL